jgi:hypothetical protein
MANLQNLPRTNRRLGTAIRIVDNRDESFETFEALEDASQARFATLCETHGNYCLHETRALANRFRVVPEEWCEECRRASEALESETEITWEGNAASAAEVREACREAVLTEYATQQVLGLRASSGDLLASLRSVRGYVIVTFRSSRHGNIGFAWLVGPRKGSKVKTLGTRYF